MKNAILTLIIITPLLVASCGGSKAEAQKVCDCYKEAEKGHKDKDDCKALLKKYKDTYKDDQAAKDQLGELCGFCI